jgi:hypothetical protein
MINVKKWKQCEKAGRGGWGGSPGKVVDRGVGNGDVSVQRILDKPETKSLSYNTLHQEPGGKSSPCQCTNTVVHHATTSSSCVRNSPIRQQANALNAGARLIN